MDGIRFCLSQSTAFLNFGAEICFGLHLWVGLVGESLQEICAGAKGRYGAVQRGKG
jgi:hypothetical protein